MSKAGYILTGVVAGAACGLVGFLAASSFSADGQEGGGKASSNAAASNPAASFGNRGGSANPNSTRARGSGGRGSAGRGPGGRGGRGGFQRTPPVEFARAETARVGVVLSSIGVARSVRSVNVATEVAGVVSEVFFEAGQSVKAGDILIQLDDREQQIALKRAEAQYPIAKRNAARFGALATDDAGSALEADNARAEAERLAAELRSAEFEVSRRSIRAPFDGVVGLFDLEPGDYVTAGMTLVALDNANEMIVTFDIPQEASADVAVGQPATLVTAVAPDGGIDGKINAVDSRVDPASRTLSVEATFDNRVGYIKPGATFEVTTRSEGVVAVRVPGIAVLWDRTGSYVWKLKKDGEAERVAVTIVQREENGALVRGAITPGDIVIADGGDRVRPGMVFQRPTRSRSGSASSISAGGLN